MQSCTQRTNLRARLWLARGAEQYGHKLQQHYTQIAKFFLLKVWDIFGENLTSFNISFTMSRLTKEVLPDLVYK